MRMGFSKPHPITSYQGLQYIACRLYYRGYCGTFLLLFSADLTIHWQFHRILILLYGKRPVAALPIQEEDSLRRSYLLEVPIRLI